MKRTDFLLLHFTQKLAHFTKITKQIIQV